MQDQRFKTSLSSLIQSHAVHSFGGGRLSCARLPTNLRGEGLQVSGTNSLPEPVEHGVVKNSSLDQFLGRQFHEIQSLTQLLSCYRHLSR